MRHLEQLQYLDESLYELKWEWSYDKKSYDIMIVQPKFQSKDDRKTKIRQVIIDFLNEKHREFTFSRGINLSKSDDQWHPDFEPARY